MRRESTQRCGAHHNWLTDVGGSRTAAIPRYQKNSRLVAGRLARWSDLLVQQAGVGEMRLLRPALSALGKRPVAMMQPPHIPNGLGLEYIGLSPEQLLQIRASKTADALWSAEQILRAGSCGALLFWSQHLGIEVSAGHKPPRLDATGSHWANHGPQHNRSRTCRLSGGLRPESDTRRELNLTVTRQASVVHPLSFCAPARCRESRRHARQESRLFRAGTPRRRIPADISLPRPGRFPPDREEK